MFVISCQLLSFQLNAVHGSFSRVLYPNEWFVICHVNQTRDLYITRARDDPSLPVASSGFNVPSS